MMGRREAFRIFPAGEEMTPLLPVFYVKRGIGGGKKLREDESGGGGAWREDRRVM